MTRNGKIARLPRAVRELINQRLADGEPGKALVTWLNGLPEVVAVLDRDFGGRGITEQNLSEWRQGGFVDWQRHQESLEWMRTAAEQAEELAAQAGAMPLTDVLSGSVALLLAKLIQEAASSATTSSESRPEARRELLGLIREWTALRKTDHRAAQLKMAQSDWEAAKAKAAEAEARAAEEAEKAQAYAESPKGKREAFEAKYAQVEAEVIRETMEKVALEKQIEEMCRIQDHKNDALLRAKIALDIRQRRDKMMKEFGQERLVEDNSGKGQVDSDDEKAGAIVANRTESDQIRPDPTAKKASNGTVGGQAADHDEQRHTPTETPGPHLRSDQERPDTRAKAGIRFPASLASLRQ